MKYNKKLHKIVHWLWGLKPVRRATMHRELAWQNIWWKKQLYPIEQYRMRQTPIIVKPQPTIILHGISSTWEAKIGEFAGRYYLDYRFFAVKNSYSRQALEWLADEIRNEVIHCLLKHCHGEPTKAKEQSGGNSNEYGFF